MLLIMTFITRVPSTSISPLGIIELKLLPLPEPEPSGDPCVTQGHHGTRVRQYLDTLLLPAGLLHHPLGKVVSATTEPGTDIFVNLMGAKHFLVQEHVMCTCIYIHKHTHIFSLSNTHIRQARILGILDEPQPNSN